MVEDHHNGYDGDGIIFERYIFSVIDGYVGLVGFIGGFPVVDVDALNIINVKQLRNARWEMGVFCSDVEVCGIFVFIFVFTDDFGDFVAFSVGSDGCFLVGIV